MRVHFLKQNSFVLSNRNALAFSAQPIKIGMPPGGNNNTIARCSPSCQKIILKFFANVKTWGAEYTETFAQRLWF